MAVIQTIEKKNLSLRITCVLRREIKIREGSTPLNSRNGQWEHRDKRAGKTQESSKSPATSDTARKAVEKQRDYSIETKRSCSWCVVIYYMFTDSRRQSTVLTYGSCREVNNSLDHRVWGHGVLQVVRRGVSFSQLPGLKKKTNKRHFIS